MKISVKHQLNVLYIKHVFLGHDNVVEICLYLICHPFICISKSKERDVPYCAILKLISYIV